MLIQALIYLPEKAVRTAGVSGAALIGIQSANFKKLLNKENRLSSPGRIRTEDSLISQSYCIVIDLKPARRRSDNTGEYTQKHESASVCLIAADTFTQLS